MVHHVVGFGEVVWIHAVFEILRLFEPSFAENVNQTSGNENGTTNDTAEDGTKV